jgi:hypothetical protein
MVNRKPRIAPPPKTVNATLMLAQSTALFPTSPVMANVLTAALVDRKFEPEPLLSVQIMVVLLALLCLKRSLAMSKLAQSTALFLTGLPSRPALLLVAAASSQEADL